MKFLGRIVTVLELSLMVEGDRYDKIFYGWCGYKLSFSFGTIEFFLSILKALEMEVMEMYY
eukprot:TRINITY_DN10873_c0_g1_i1.p1 TRINITY_DN10873_c0_g1~~TRINITY_DN10873_c0_g1_i1.p1  ORF type:complete len:61 (-),score=6.35 TRINITY_DN10873_c0_g1_i1:163-345(-)